MIPKESLNVNNLPSLIQPYVRIMIVFTLQAPLADAIFLGKS